MEHITELIKLLHEKDIQELIKDLENPNSDTRRHAHSCLVRAGDEAIQPLCALLHGADQQLVYEATLILGEMNSPKSPRLLVASLQDDRPIVQWNATKALIKLERGALVPLLDALVRNRGPIPLQNGSREVLRSLDQNHYLTRIEEKVLVALEGAYSDAEVAYVARVALEALKGHS